MRLHIPQDVLRLLRTDVVGQTTPVVRVGPESGRLSSRRCASEIERNMAAPLRQSPVSTVLSGSTTDPTRPDVQTGLPHPRAYGNFPRLIARYVRERHVLTLPEAIRKMTGWPATRMRLAHRGTIAVGNWADVTIFDYDAIQDRATFEKPMELPVGIAYVLVNGVVTIDRGKHTGAKAGHVLWGPGRSDR